MKRCGNTQRFFYKNKIMKRLNIFDVFLFESDVEWFINLSKAEKIAWILENTKQTDENLINEFVLNPKITNTKHCIGCKDLKQKITINEIVEKNEITQTVKKRR